MRTISFIFAFAVLMLGPSMAGSTDGALPGIGTFEFNGTFAAAPSDAPIMMAAVR